LLRLPLRKKARLTAGFTWPPLTLLSSQMIKARVRPINSGFHHKDAQSKRKVPRNSAEESAVEHFLLLTVET
jgi:hypothetical protein